MLEPVKIYVVTDQNQIFTISNHVRQNKLSLHCFGLMERWWSTPEIIKALSVAEVDGNIVGAAMVVNHPSYTIGVYVKPKYRRQGIAGHLLSPLAEYEDSFVVDKTSFREAMFRKYLKGKVV